VSDVEETDMCADSYSKDSVARCSISITVHHCSSNQVRSTAASSFKIEQLAMLNPKQINQLVYSTFAHHDAVKMAFRKLLEHANMKYNVWNDKIESSLDA
jgi:hypothetical protein